MGRAIANQLSNIWKTPSAMVHSDYLIWYGWCTSCSAPTCPLWRVIITSHLSFSFSSCDSVLKLSTGKALGWCHAACMQALPTRCIRRGACDGESWWGTICRPPFMMHWLQCWQGSTLFTLCLENPQSLLQHGKHQLSWDLWMPPYLFLFKIIVFCALLDSFTGEKERQEGWNTSPQLLNHQHLSYVGQLVVHHPISTVLIMNDHCNWC